MSIAEAASEYFARNLSQKWFNAAGRWEPYKRGISLATSSEISYEKDVWESGERTSNTVIAKVLKLSRINTIAKNHYVNRNSLSKYINSIKYSEKITLSLIESWVKENDSLSSYFWMVPHHTKKKHDIPIKVIYAGSIIGLIRTMEQALNEDTN